MKALGFKTYADLAQAIIKGETSDTLSSVKGLKPFFGLSPPKGGFKRSSRRAVQGGRDPRREPACSPEIVRRMI